MKKSTLAAIAAAIIGAAAGAGAATLATGNTPSGTTPDICVDALLKADDIIFEYNHGRTVPDADIDRWLDLADECAGKPA